MKVIKALMTMFIVGSVTIAGDSFGAAASNMTQSIAGGGVTVKVTYLAETAHEARFSVVLDTHSVNLDGYDLRALSVLRDDTGLSMQPTGVENKGSGHHREIILTFPRASLDRKWLELIVKDIAGAKERTFRWNRE
jgi:hypothetical protein